MNVSQVNRELTLVEIVVATGLLAFVLLGFGSTLRVVQQSQAAAKERLAAGFAATELLEQIVADDFADVDSYGLQSFNVVNSPTEMGLATVQTDFLLKASTDPTRFPASRVASGATTEAGFLEVVDVRTGLKEVRATVAWQTIGGGSESRSWAVRIAQ
jgi:type II secretory pathway pseudopilin PulG